MDDIQERTEQSLVAEINDLKATVAALEEKLSSITMETENIRPPSIECDHLLDFAPYAIEDLADGVFLVSKDSIIRYVNEAACRMHGYTRDEMIGMSVLAIHPTFTREQWDAGWEVAVKTRKRPPAEFEHVKKDGTILPVELVASIIVLNGNEYSYSFVRDISERKKMERRIAQSEKMEAIGLLAGGIAHDFNNQLAGIVGYADILLSEVGADERQRRMAKGILTGAKNAADLTGQLLAYARQGTFLSVPMDLHRTIDEVVEMLKRTVDKRIVLSTRLEASPSVTIGDPSQLQNALLNLAINARDAMPEGGRLTFSTATVVLDESYCKKAPYKISPGQYVQVSVADSGTGIPEEVRDRIFEPFFTTKQRGKGTGMGLAAVFGTVKNHKGAINVYSESGLGTEVTLYLPLVLDKKAVVDTVVAPRPASTISAHILLVDDEPVIRDVTKEMLKHLGCRVTVARNGVEAIEMYKSTFNSIDLVILDLVMPELSGRDTFLQMRDINPGIATILASGYSLAGEVQALLDMGVNAFIQKPFRISDLSKKVSDILFERSRQAERR